ncbi:MAG: GWxTD domain-containing protein [Gemmatimonadota bacterium]
MRLSYPAPRSGLSGLQGNPTGHSTGGSSGASRGRALVAGLVLGGLALTACAGNRSVGAPGGDPTPTAGRGGRGAGAAIQPGAEMQGLYRGMGLISGIGAIPFVSSVSFLQSPTPDSTLTLVAMSLPARALGFTREDDRYAAVYVVRIELRQGGTLVRQLEAKETVRVPTFRETSRTDESVIWQQFLRLAPGRYGMTMVVRDEGGIRNAAEEVSIEVPRLAPGALGSPIAVYEIIPRGSADSLPRLLARPRSTVTFGADSILPVYVEATGADAPARVSARVVGEGDQVLWEGAVDLTQRGNLRSAVLPVPVANMGIGVSTLSIAAQGKADTVRTRLMVSLGDDLPIASFQEMLGYLRYFTPPDRLKGLREATPVQRAALWTEFLRSTDPLPGTPEHEGLRDYFARIRQANLRFRDDAQVGWMSDRAAAFLGLGDPDQIYDTGFNDGSMRARQQVWEYRAYRLQLVFQDQTGFGRWRLAPNQMSDLQNAIRRRLAGLP